MRPSLAFLIGPLLLFLAGCAGTGLTIPTVGANGAREEVPATLLKPEGSGPFPAVVVLHDCSGLGPTSSGSPERWANWLASNGYIVLLPDSFASRGFPGGICTVPSPKRSDVSIAKRVRDAYSALAYLRTLPYVNPDRIGLMGNSHGGTTTLATMVIPDNASDAIVRERKSGFSAAIALYPGCAPAAGSKRPDDSDVYRAVAPVLILIGEEDDWTPAAPCRELTEVASRAGFPVSIKVYPGAHHAFDSNLPMRNVAAPNAPSGHSATVGGNSAAWADSAREVDVFFGRILKQE